jgi:anti-sigma regulatory factor (Ser/Thr protein kinase)
MGAHGSVDHQSPLGRYEAQLPAELESVVAARRLLTSAVSAWHLGDGVKTDGSLAISELVSNSVLHAGTNISVAVHRLGNGVRIEVSDGNSHLPIVDAARPEDLLANRSMTGRGLALVAAMSDRWGAEPRRAGKVVWAEVGTGRRVVGSVPPPAFPPVPREAPVPAAAAAAGVVTRTAVTAGGRPIRLIGVPVHLILESTRHLADLQREMQVMAMAHTAPPEVEGVVQAGRPWTTDLDLWADADRRMAESAQARGEEVVDFEVVVPEDITKRIEGIAQWMSRTASALVRRHLLTLPARPEVTAYRRWYADEILAQLSGQEPRPCPIKGQAARV